MTDINVEKYKKKLLALKKELEEAEARGADSRKPVELDQTHGRTAVAYGCHAATGNGASQLPPP